MIATYNQPEYIEKAVVSALGQDYPSLEVIVSDDSDNDETGKVLEKFRSDKRFSYFKNPVNIGRVSNYRRLLFELAKGEWVVMLDGDDFYNDPQYISRVMQMIGADTGIVLVGSGINILEERTGKVTPRKLVEEDRIFEGADIFRKHLPLPNHQTDVYRRDLACRLDFYRDPSMGSDSESLFRLCLHGKVVYLKGMAATWRIHETNTTFNRDIDKQIEELVFIDKVSSYAADFLDKRTIASWHRHMYSMMAHHLLELAITSGKSKNMWKILFRFQKYFGKKQRLILAAKTLIGKYSGSVNK